MPIQQRVLICALFLCARTEDAAAFQSLLPAANNASVGAIQSHGQVPISFIENNGQLPSSVAYYVVGSDKTLYFTQDGVTISVWGDDPSTSQLETRWNIRLDFISPMKVCIPHGREERDATVSHFSGAGVGASRTSRVYAEIVYENLWPGIDLIWSGSEGTIKHEFRVAPGADPKQVVLAYRGVTEVAVCQRGSLAIRTPVATLHDARPYAYQGSTADVIEIPVSYELKPNVELSHSFGFALGKFDPTQTLVIDPAMTIYSGFIGGADQDEAYSIAVDQFGCAYIAGMTRSDEMTFPVRVGPDIERAGSTLDVFVVKVNAAGTDLVYAGYIEGALSDRGFAIAVDQAGNAYVAGATDSPESAGFPVLIGPDLTQNSKGKITGFDGFVAKIRADGTALEYCGYIGGDGDDFVYGIAVDDEGSAYVVGTTDSAPETFPLSVGPHLSRGGGTDAFVAKVTPNGASLVYCGYIAGDEHDEGLAIAVDSQRCAYVTGWTEGGLPVSIGPDLTFNGGCDIFAARISSTGTAFDYCGYVGGVKGDEGKGIAVSAMREAYITGRTNSRQGDRFPVLVGPDLTHNGDKDAFALRVSADGSSLIYCGYIGGSMADVAEAAALDAAGNLIITGLTDSSELTFPTTIGPDLSYNGEVDAFVARIRSDGSSLDYCGYIGGDDFEWGRGVALDTLGNAYVTGYTFSTESTFPTRDGPDLSFNGGNDAFLTKVEAFEIAPSTACRAGTVNLGNSNATEDVLLVNASAGDLLRTIRVQPGQPLTLSMQAPSAGPFPAPFACYLWPQSPTDNTVSPHPFNLGSMCFPTLLSGGTPLPTKVWNNAGRQRVLGTPNYTSQPAPSLLLSNAAPPLPITATLQGVIADAGSAANVAASITNAVIIEVE